MASLRAGPTSISSAAMPTRPRASRRSPSLSHRARRRHRDARHGGASKADLIAPGRRFPNCRDRRPLHDQRRGPARPVADASTTPTPRFAARHRQSRLWPVPRSERLDTPAALRGGSIRPSTRIRFRAARGARVAYIVEGGSISTCCRCCRNALMAMEHHEDRWCKRSEGGVIRMPRHSRRRPIATELIDVRARAPARPTTRRSQRRAVRRWPSATAPRVLLDSPPPSCVFARLRRAAQSDALAAPQRIRTIRARPTRHPATSTPRCGASRPSSARQGVYAAPAATDAQWPARATRRAARPVRVARAGGLFFDGCVIATTRAARQPAGAAHAGGPFCVGGGDEGWRRA